jgi:hypothetical protein
VLWMCECAATAKKFEQRRNDGATIGDTRGQRIVRSEDSKADVLIRYIYTSINGRRFIQKPRKSDTNKTHHMSCQSIAIPPLRVQLVQFSRLLAHLFQRPRYIKPIT